MPSLIEIKESHLLKDNVPVLFKAKAGSLTLFHFQIDSHKIIKIQKWPLDRYSEPDLYMAVNQNQVSSVNYSWKSNRISADEIIVDPEDP